MKRTTTLLPLTLLALGLNTATPAALAQSTAAPATAASASALPLVDAEVRRVDPVTGKVTLKHGDIPNLDMPAMTMAFRVADAKMLDGLAEGAKVRFDVEKRNGQYTVVKLAPAP